MVKVNVGDTILVKQTITEIRPSSVYTRTPSGNMQWVNLQDIDSVIPTPWVPKVGDSYSIGTKFPFNIIAESEEYFFVQTQSGMPHAAKKLNFAEGRTKIYD